MSPRGERTYSQAMRIGVLIVGLVLAFAAGWLVRGVPESGRPGDVQLNRANGAREPGAIPGLRGQVSEGSSQVGPSQVGPSQVSIAQDGTAQVGIAQINFA